MVVWTIHYHLSQLPEMALDSGLTTWPCLLHILNDAQNHSMIWSAFNICLVSAALIISPVHIMQFQPVMPDIIISTTSWSNVYGNFSFIIWDWRMPMSYLQRSYFCGYLEGNHGSHKCNNSVHCWVTHKEVHFNSHLILTVSTEARYWQDSNYSQWLFKGVLETFCWGLQIHCTYHHPFTRAKGAHELS